MKWLRMKDIDNLKEDPRFDYMVGRLVGTTEMLAFYMQLHGDEKGKGMAGRAYETLRFFFDPSELRELRTTQTAVPPYDAPTEIIPPKSANPSRPNT